MESLLCFQGFVKLGHQGNEKEKDSHSGKAGTDWTGLSDGGAGVCGKLTAYYIQVNREAGLCLSLNKKLRLLCTDRQGVRFVVYSWIQSR